MRSLAFFAVVSATPPAWAICVGATGDDTVTVTPSDCSEVCSASCSLREAITLANSGTGATITFNTASLSVLDSEPAITVPVLIDGGGTTTLFAGTGGSFNGITLGTGSDGSTVQNLAFTHFSGGNALEIDAPNVTVQGSRFGVGFDGDTSAPGMYNGIYVGVAGASALIGSSAPSGRNLISHSTYGVVAYAMTTIIGNWIGTSVDGESSLGNGFGIQCYASCTVGTVASGEGNVISGNLNVAIGVAVGASGINIAGNAIGVSPSGLALGNQGSGNHALHLLGSNVTVGPGNIISGNQGDAIYSIGDNFTVFNNLIGLDPTGALAMGNGGKGIWLNGGANVVVGPGNYISGNAIGIEANSASTIVGNNIGTDVTGNTAIGNASYAIYAIAAQTIGSPLLGGNQIAGNGYGLSVLPGSVVQSNIIGVGANGSALGNGHFGVSAVDAIIGGTGPLEGNIIANNDGPGVLVFGSMSVVAGNAIINNTGDGVQSASAAVTAVIGGLEPGADNAISGNGGNGINAASGTLVVLGNAIADNALLGYDALSSGVTPNDFPDVDGLPNFPTLTSAIASPNGIVINGTLQAVAGSGYVVYAYISDACDAPSGTNGEGNTPLAQQTVTTGPSGSVDFTLNASAASGSVITAIATLTDGVNPIASSEFSLCAPIVKSGVFAFDAASASVTEGGTASVNVVRTFGTDGAVTLTLTASGTAGAARYSAPTQVTFANGETSKVVTVSTVDDQMVQSDETVVLTLSAPTGATLGATAAWTLTLSDNDSGDTGSTGSSGDSGTMMMMMTPADMPPSDMTSDAAKTKSGCACGQEASLPELALLAAVVLMLSRRRRHHRQ